MRAQRHANGDFARALTNRGVHHAIGAHGGEQQSQGGKNSNQHCGKPPCSDRIREHFLHGKNASNGQGGISVMDDFRGRGGHRMRVRNRANHYVIPPVNSEICIISARGIQTHLADVAHYPHDGKPAGFRVQRAEIDTLVEGIASGKEATR